MGNHLLLRRGDGCARKFGAVQFSLVNGNYRNLSNILKTTNKLGILLSSKSCKCRGVVVAALMLQYLLREAWTSPLSHPCCSPRIESRVLFISRVPYYCKYGFPCIINTCKINEDFTVQKRLAGLPGVFWEAHILPPPLDILVSFAQRIGELCWICLKMGCTAQNFKHWQFTWT